LINDMVKARFSGKLDGNKNENYVPFPATAMQRMLEKDVRDKVIIDVGAGTGIQALAALKSGAKLAILIEYDSDFVDDARKNFELNGRYDEDGNYTAFKEGVDFVILPAESSDLTETHKVAEALHNSGLLRDENVLMISNIGGDHEGLYTVTNKQTVELIQSLQQLSGSESPSLVVQDVIFGGYDTTNASHVDLLKENLDSLKALGYEDGHQKTSLHWYDSTLDQGGEVLAFSMSSAASSPVGKRESLLEQKKAEIEKLERQHAIYTDAYLELSDNSSAVEDGQIERIESSMQDVSSEINRLHSQISFIERNFTASTKEEGSASPVTTPKVEVSRASSTPIDTKRGIVSSSPIGIESYKPHHEVSEPLMGRLRQASKRELDIMLRQISPLQDSRVRTRAAGRLMAVVGDIYASMGKGENLADPANPDIDMLTDNYHNALHNDLVTNAMSMLSQGSGLVATQRDAILTVLAPLMHDLHARKTVHEFSGPKYIRRSLIGSL